MNLPTDRRGQRALRILRSSNSGLPRRFPRETRRFCGPWWSSWRRKPECRRYIDIAAAAGGEPVREGHDAAIAPAGKSGSELDAGPERRPSGRPAGATSRAVRAEPATSVDAKPAASARPCARPVARRPTGPIAAAVGQVCPEASLDSPARARRVRSHADQPQMEAYRIEMEVELHGDRARQHRQRHCQRQGGDRGRHIDAAWIFGRIIASSTCPKACRSQIFKDLQKVRVVGRELRISRVSERSLRQTASGYLDGPASRPAAPASRGEMNTPSRRK